MRQNHNLLPCPFQSFGKTPDRFVRKRDYLQGRASPYIPETLATWVNIPGTSAAKTQRPRFHDRPPMRRGEVPAVVRGRGGPSFVLPRGHASLLAHPMYSGPTTNSVDMARVSPSYRHAVRQPQNEYRPHLCSTMPQGHNHSRPTRNIQRPTSSHHSRLIPTPASLCPVSRQRGLSS